MFVEVGSLVVSKNRKLDNDDLDVTKNAEIVVTIAESLADIPVNRVPQTPYSFGNAKIFAGFGVGVVTKDGLKAPKGYPAINPTPLRELERCYKILGKDRELFCSISITDGEKLAKNTANSRVGVIGGLSILGTTGFVKPVSNDAFLGGVETELSVAEAEGFREIIFTLGNSSLEVAKSRFAENQIIEIGNFIYDSISLALERKFRKITLFIGRAKALKIAQGHRDTHNRFGTIDLEKFQRELKDTLNIDVEITSTETVKGIFEQLKSLKEIESAENLIKISAEREIKEWFGLDKMEIVLV